MQLKELFRLVKGSSSSRSSRSKETSTLQSKLCPQNKLSPKSKLDGDLNNNNKNDHSKSKTGKKPKTNKQSAPTTTTTTTISHLPELCLSHVFRHVSLVRLRQLRLVCPLWRDLIERHFRHRCDRLFLSCNTVLSKPTHPHHPSWHVDQDPLLCLNRTHRSEVNLVVNGHFAADSVAQLHDLVPGVTHLVLAVHFDSALFGQVPPLLSRYAATLTTLHLFTYGHFPKQVDGWYSVKISATFRALTKALKSLSSLTSLNLFTDDEMLQTVQRHLGPLMLGLKHVAFNGHPIQWNYVSRFLGPQCHSLTFNSELFHLYPLITSNPRILDMLARNLTEIRLNHLVTVATLSFVGHHFPALKLLEFHHCFMFAPHQTAYDNEVFGEVARMSSLTDLRVNALWNDINSIDYFFANLHHTLTTITHLTLSHLYLWNHSGSNFTSSFFRHLLAKLPNLTRLTLVFYPKCKRRYKLGPFHFTRVRQTATELERKISRLLRKLDMKKVVELQVMYHWDVHKYMREVYDRDRTDRPFNDHSIGLGMAWHKITNTTTTIANQ